MNKRKKTLPKSAPLRRRQLVTWKLVPVLIATVAALLVWVIHSQRHPDSVHANSRNAGAGFAPTLVNRTSVAGERPSGMERIPGGEFSVGANDPPDIDDVGMKATQDAPLIHRVYVDGFLMDKTDVTNAQFAKFVKATGYLTVAERPPRAEDFPNAPPENLVAGTVVFSQPNHPVPLNGHFQWWSYVPGANWRHPLGLHYDGTMT